MLGQNLPPPPPPGWNRAKESENFGAGRPCSYAPEYLSSFIPVLMHCNGFLSRNPFGLRLHLTDILRQFLPLFGILLITHDLLSHRIALPWHDTVSENLKSR